MILKLLAIVLGGAFTYTTALPMQYKYKNSECATSAGRRTEESEYPEGNVSINKCKEACDNMYFCNSFEWYPNRLGHKKCRKYYENGEQSGKCKCMLNIGTWGDEIATRGFGFTRV